MGTREDKVHLAEQVKEDDRDAWSTTNALRLSAAFRHYSQATLRQREWVPKAWVGEANHSWAIASLSLFGDPSVQAHKPLKRLPSDLASGKRRLRRVNGKQPDKSCVEKDEPAEQQNDADDASSDSISSSSSSSSSSSNASSDNERHNECHSEPHNEPHNEPDNEPDNETADNEPPPQVPTTGSSSSSSIPQHGLSDLWMI